MNKLIELKNATKSQFLFKSEDNVEIFEGDLYYFVCDIDAVPKKSFKLYCDVMPEFTGEKSRPPLGKKQFKSKEAAENWIMYNKPCLSINDILPLKKVSFIYWEDTLKEIVKSKL